MKKLLMMMVGAAAIGAVAQEVEVLAPIAVPAPVVVAVPTAVAVADEVEPGALCKTYLINEDAYNCRQEYKAATLDEWLGSAVAVDQAYDDKSEKFDARKVAQPEHVFDVACWEGVFLAKKDGEYIFTVNSPFVYGVYVNDKGVKGVGQMNFSVNMHQGQNKIVVWRYVFNGRNYKDGFTLDYRLATSVKQAKPITPAMLMHVVEEEEEW